MGTTKNATKNACIATALVLLALGVFAAPSAAADDDVPSEPQPQDDGPCFWVTFDPPNAGVSQNPVEDCI